jgi:hypothetical protein
MFCSKLAEAMANPAEDVVDNANTQNGVSVLKLLMVAVVIAGGFDWKRKTLIFVNLTMLIDRESALSEGPL